MVAAPHTITPFAAILQAVEPLLAPGYERLPGAACTGKEAYAGATQREACRWLAGSPSVAGEPIVVELAASRFAGRTPALQALCTPPVLPVGMTIRRLFPPRLGDESVAVRADLAEDGERYVLYRVDLAVHQTVVSLAAAWRWPAGSPKWLYLRAQAVAAVLRGTPDSRPRQ